MFRIELSTGASAIPRDTTHNNGWDYTDASQLMVRIYAAGLHRRHERCRGRCPHHRPLLDPRSG
jgi:hypothetical protein